MSKLDELIQELCPNGVEYRKIEEFIDYIQPAKYIVSDTKYDDSYNVPVLTAGQSFILGYTNENTGVYQASKENPVIIFDDFTAGFHWVDFPFKVKSSAMKILVQKGNINFRYFYHLMGMINYKSTEHTRLWIGTYSQFEVPVPPMEVQSEIVRILDNFTLLTAELTAELTARKQQYEYYRDYLLNFENKKITYSVEYKTIGDVTRIERGVRITKKDLIQDGKYPVISGGTKPLGYINNFNRRKGTITIAQYGSAGYVDIQNQDFWANDVCYSVFPSSEIENRYLYYCLVNNQELLYSLTTKAIPDHLPLERLKAVIIPIPPKKVQGEISNLLDNFNIYCKDITKGLPAEIELRQKQYEYYRDKLLTFKELK